MGVRKIATVPTLDNPRRDRLEGTEITTRMEASNGVQEREIFPKHVVDGTKHQSKNV